MPETKKELGKGMKLLFCKDCSDIFLMRSFLRRCQCGESTGVYADCGVIVKVSGPCSVLLFDHESFVGALHNTLSTLELFKAYCVVDDGAASVERAT